MSKVDDYFWFLPDKGCYPCIDHWQTTPFLVEAFASVGIAHNKSTGRMAQEYFLSYHRGGHQDDQSTH